MTEYTALQIVDFLKSGSGPGSLFASSELAQQLAAKHVEARDMMTRLQAAMSEAWSGDASAQALAGVGPLVAASEVSAVHLNAAQDSLATQGADYADLRNKVGDGPGPQPQEDFLSRHLPVFTHKDEEIAGWNAKAEEVVQHYGTYNGQSSGNTARLPRDYGELTLPSGGADIEHAEKPAAVEQDDRRVGTERRGTDVAGQDTSWQQQRPGTDTRPTPGQVTAVQQQRPGADTRTTAGQVIPGQQQRPGAATGPGQPRPGAGPDDATRTSGLAPVAHTGSGDGSGRPSLPGGGFGRDGGSGDIDSRLGPGVPALGGPREAGRFGTPGSGPGGGRSETVSEPGGGRNGIGREPGGGRSGREPGGGRSGTGSEPGGRSGAERFGEPGVTRPGLPGASGKPGTGGIGGPLGRGGPKEEDKEHKRLEVLQEPDPDELFGGFPDGMKPVAPTIGA